ncbi:Sodium- and chloride-dependent transporter [Helicobacter sp. NHP19-003]|uniref:Sodium-and chloride-dependent transporter n=1 Tax=Helicobacter gastrocanis TaxID=2849641 RepID=A0ABM7SBM3_9HELI|nr:sodium-dependent transporter [Helicobacter sp. NHP19-003]BCZ17178.1 Sodium- and chloride-dependent transporter [Helicobacter sp. NHP19-003]
MGFSKLGFILATLGSSIGLGHIWRFPYMAGECGGGAFVLLYLGLTLTLGVAMLLADMLIGNLGRKDMVSCYQHLNTRHKKLWGFSAVFLLGGPIILSFYTVVLGWVLFYLVKVSFALPQTLESSKTLFQNLSSVDLFWQIVGFSVWLWLTVWIVSKGIKQGIEKLSLWLMPLLFLVFIGLLFYAMSMPSFSKAWHYMFAFDSSKITLGVLMDALGQMFFSLSLGVGTITTYAAFTKSNENLLGSSLWVVLPGIFISLVAGLMIFTFIFKFNGTPAQGVGLVFISLPLVFHQMGFTGSIVALFFFLALIFAGITSTVSLLEPTVLYLTNHFKHSRTKACVFVGGLTYLLGLLVIFSMHKDYSHALSFWGKNVFEWADFSTSTVLMPLGGLFSLLFLGYFMDKKRIYKSSKRFLSRFWFLLWFFSVRFVAPVAVLLILMLQFKKNA